MKPCKFCKEKKRIGHKDITVLPEKYYIPVYGASDESGKSELIRVKIGGGDYTVVKCGRCGAIGPQSKSKSWATRRWNGGAYV